MEIAMEFASFCNICFNKNNLRKIDETEDLTRILMLFIENKILLKEQEVYLCLNCCEKLESYDKFKEMCSRNFTDFRIEYSKLKKKLEVTKDPNIEKKLRNFIETKVDGTIIMDDSEDPLATPCVMSPPEPKNNLIGTEDKGNISDYNFHSVTCKTEKEDHEVNEDCELPTECYLEENEENSELPLPIEHIKLEPFAEEDFDTNESSNEIELIKEPPSTEPYQTKNKSTALTANPIQSEKKGSVIALKKNERLTGKTPSQLACEICKKTFCKPSSLTRHMRTHTGEKPYVCAICDKSFSHSNTLKRHFTVHTGERRYPCSMCGKRFTESGNLRRHELVHTGERPYTCPVCNKSFRDQTHFKLHERVHTGEKPYECADCLKRFADPTTYKIHKLTHTGEKPHKCKVCNKSFRQSVHLREHSHIHTRTKYSCDKCKKSFGLARDLRLHKKKSCGPNLPKGKTK